MIDIINQVNDLLWGYVIIAVLVGCGVWFTVRMRFVQFRMLGEMVRLLNDSPVKVKGQERHISSFQAFTVSLASRIGTGNLAGVATAIVVGGPGAVFWMWVMALFGAATAFVESTLGQLYKLRHSESFIGGPAYYIQRGLHCRWMAVLFAILITVTFGLANNSVQTNTICGAMEGAFGWNPTIVGIVLMVLTLLVVFGGIQRIARVSSILVPLMALGYLILALVIIVMNIHLIPHVFKVIIESAFGLEQAVGGTVGAAIMNGVKRGLFSNEAGEGSAPNAAATAAVSHPVKQGFIQALGVFTDTLVVCSCTAFIILISGFYEHPQLDVCLFQYDWQLLLRRGEHPFHDQSPDSPHRLSYPLRRRDGDVGCPPLVEHRMEHHRLLHGVAHSLQPGSHHPVGKIRLPPARRLHQPAAARHQESHFPSFPNPRNRARSRVLGLMISKCPVFGQL